MGLLKKKKKKKPLRTGGAGASGGQKSPLRPQQVFKVPPCIDHCPNNNDIRSWVTLISLREKYGMSEEDAMKTAWEKLTERNPFPSTMGRVCPHPCEGNCNREAKDGGVAINALESFIGDWGIEKNLPLPKVEGEDKKEESIGVLGAGPGGLSFAYQLARRGYPVTVYEQFSNAGGMLYYGIPFYRLPENVLEKEIQKILDVGIELKLDTKVGKDISIDELKQKHKMLFLGVGAHKGKKLGCPGEEGSGVWAGTDYLNLVNKGEKVNVGKSSVIIGGGDTAIDAARMAKRAGADVTILYRRTRTEMPAIDSEVEDAYKEDIKIDFLVAPVEVKRNDDNSVKAIVVRKMELGEPDSSGRRRPVPIDGSDYEIEVDSIIPAISQEADWDPIPELKPKTRWLEPDKTGKIEDNVWAGGDVIDLGLAIDAIAQGRKAAEAVHAFLRDKEIPRKPDHPMIKKDRIMLDFYDAKPKVERGHRPVEEWLSKPNDEIFQNLTKEQFLEETTRCFSCGNCFGCERCWMYCTPSCFSKMPVNEITEGEGNFYKVKLDVCDGCKKCGDECPCGFLDML